MVGGGGEGTRRRVRNYGVNSQWKREMETEASGWCNCLTLCNEIVFRYFESVVYWGYRIACHREGRIAKYDCKLTFYRPLLKAMKVWKWLNRPDEDTTSTTSGKSHIAIFLDIQTKSYFNFTTMTHAMYSSSPLFLCNCKASFSTLYLVADGSAEAQKVLHRIVVRVKVVVLARSNYST